MSANTGKPNDGPDLDDPGYMRHCAFPLCPAGFHALRGGADGWRMGRSGPIGASYFCPDHVPLVLAHIPGWLRDASPVTGTLCACGWRWAPAVQMPRGDHRLAWLLHLRPAADLARRNEEYEPYACGEPGSRL